MVAAESEGVRSGVGGESVKEKARGWEEIDQ